MRLLALLRAIVAVAFVLTAAAYFGSTTGILSTSEDYASAGEIARPDTAKTRMAAAVRDLFKKRETPSENETAEAAGLGQSISERMREAMFGNVEMAPASKSTRTASAGGPRVLSGGNAGKRVAAPLRAPTRSEPASVGEAVFSGIQSSSDALRAEAVFDTSTLNDRRRVTFSFDVDPEALLKPGETMEAMGGVEALGQAKLPDMAAAHCEFVVPKLGRDCALLDFSQIVLKNGKIRGTATLAYLPPEDLGRAAQDASAAYKPFIGGITLDENGIEVSRDRIKSAWHRYFVKAQQACAALRNRAGACVIEELRLIEKEVWNDDSKVVVRAKVTFGVRMAEGSPSEDDLQKAAARALN